MRRHVLLLFLLGMVVCLSGCGSPRSKELVMPPPEQVENDITTPATAAEQDVVVKRDAVDKARKSGDVGDTLNAERALFLARARLAAQQAAQWKQAAKDKDKEISDERDRKRQEFLYWFSGICGFLALLAGVGSFVWPTARIILRPVAMILGVLCPASLFAAWLVPYMWIIAIVTGSGLLAAAGWYLSSNERRHRLKDKATDQVIAAVEDAKGHIPEFRGQYKSIFAKRIDTDADRLIDERRDHLDRLAAAEEARVAAKRAAA
jgi:hypothetical protein